MNLCQRFVVHKTFKLGSVLVCMGFHLEIKHISIIQSSSHMHIGLGKGIHLNLKSILKACNFSNMSLSNNHGVYGYSFQNEHYVGGLQVIKHPNLGLLGVCGYSFEPMDYVGGLQLFKHVNLGLFDLNSSHILVLNLFQ